jgi:hypothetical protein
MDDRYGCGLMNIEAAGRGLYFFLSYAHSPTGPDREGAAADLWVTRFYQDLSDQVTRLARPGQGHEVGFMADHRPATEEWKARAAAALGAAEVFVQLYSPDYLLRPWPLGEWSTFRGRLAGLAAERGRGHVQPVWWVPLLSGQQTPELDQALELGANVPEYARNGLLAMCRLTIFRSQYATILHRLAQRIVTVAEKAPLPRVAAPVSIEFAPPPSDQASFVIGVIASDEDWHPFANAGSLPATDYAAQVAQRLGLGTYTVDLLENAEGLTSTAGIVLVDPSVLAVTGGRTRLLTTVKALPEWAVLFVLADERGPGYLADAVELLRGHQHVVKSARTAASFVQLMPQVVTQARRRFLGRAPMFPPHGSRTPPTGRRLPRLDDLGD